jgi:hypothetical protein
MVVTFFNLKGKTIAGSLDKEITQPQKIINMKMRAARCYFMIILLAPLFSWSQKKTFISVGGELAFPVGNYMEVGKTGFGGSLRLEHIWSKKVSGIVTLEYISFSTNETNQFMTQKFSALPVLFGVKYYTRENNSVPRGLYFSGELGFMGEFYTVHFVGGTIPEPEYHENYLGFC